MPQGSIRINKALTNLSILYKNESYIANEAIPNIPVTKDSDLYWIYNSDFRLEDSYRANKSQANMATYGMSTSSYVCLEQALKDIVSDTDRDNAEAPLMLDKDVTEYLVDKILMRQEVDCATLLFTTTNWSNNKTILTATSWAYNTLTSNPILDVLSATSVINLNSGKHPNTMVIGLSGFNALRENNNVFGRIQYVERSIVTEEILASLFDIKKVFVGRGAYTTANEGLAASLSVIWGPDAWLAYVEPTPSLRRASAAGCFRVTSKGSPYRVKSWREEDVEGTMIEVQTKYSYRAIATSCAFLFKDVNTQ
jgi:hypothetical protein